MRCSGCGNEIPTWANGICYVCGRISREERRFGRHNSGYAQARHEPTRHFPAPTPADSEVGGVPPPATPATVPPPLQPDLCPVCGQQVPQELLKQHVDEHGRILARGSSLVRASRAGSAHVDGSSDEPTERSATHAAAWLPQQERLCRQGINRLLEAVYRRPRLLSDILHEGGLGEDAICVIRQRHLATFLRGVIKGWESEFTRSLLGPRWHLLYRRFSLDGLPAPTEADIGVELSLSSESVRQLEASALSSMRSRVGKELLETIVVRAARRCLNEDHAGPARRRG